MTESRFRAIRRDGYSHRAEHTGVSSGRNKQRTIFYNGAVWFCRMPKHGLTKERYDTTTRGLDDYQAHCRL